jgi:hypothetical protein
MFEIELPCCGTTTHLAELPDAVRCEECSVVLELEPTSTFEALPLAA